MNKYEAMLVLESGFGGKEWELVEAGLREIFERFGAEVESLEKWAERRLAYEINKQRRATYAHVVFQMDPQQVTPMRDFCTLDERILRFLILRFDPDAQKHLPSDTLFATRGRPGDRPSPRRKETSSEPEKADGASPAEAGKTGAAVGKETKAEPEKADAAGPADAEKAGGADGSEETVVEPAATDPAS